MQTPDAKSLPPHIRRALVAALSPDDGAIRVLHPKERSALVALITLIDPAAPGAPFVVPMAGLADYLRRSRITTTRYLQTLRSAGMLELVERPATYRLTPEALAALFLA